MRAQFWNFQFGNRKKAMVLTLDALLAVLIVSLALSASVVYISMEKNVMPDSQTARIGSDIITLAENSGILRGFDVYNISRYINSTLPDTYGMRINLTWSDYSLVHNYNIIVGDPIPEKKFVATGKRFFVVIDYNTTLVTNYAVIKYWIWSK